MGGPVVPMSAARASLAALLGRVVGRAERIALSRHGRVVAALVPARDLARLERLDAVPGEGPGTAPRYVGREGRGPSSPSPRAATWVGSTDVLLVPGAFLGPWVFADVVRLLAQAGISASAVSLPSSSGRSVDPEDDLEVLRRAVDAAPGAVVCGHGYGAALVTALGARPSLERLVFIAGVVPDRGERVGDRLAGAGDDPGISLVATTARSDGVTEVDPREEGDRLFADCGPARRAVARSRLRPFALGALDLRIDEPAWRHAPTTLILTADDGRETLLSPGVIAAGPESIELSSGPCPQWSRPEEISAILSDAVRGRRTTSGSGSGAGSGTTTG